MEDHDDIDNGRNRMGRTTVAVDDDDDYAMQQQQQQQQAFSVVTTSATTAFLPQVEEEEKSWYTEDDDDLTPTIGHDDDDDVRAVETEIIHLEQQYSEQQQTTTTQSKNNNNNNNGYEEQIIQNLNKYIVDDDDVKDESNSSIHPDNLMIHNNNTINSHLPRNLLSNSSTTRGNSNNTNSTTTGDVSPRSNNNTSRFNSSLMSLNSDPGRTRLRAENLLTSSSTIGGGGGGGIVNRNDDNDDDDDDDSIPERRRNTFAVRDSSEMGATTRLRNSSRSKFPLRIMSSFRSSNSSTSKRSVLLGSGGGAFSPSASSRNFGRLSSSEHNSSNFLTSSSSLHLTTTSNNLINNNRNNNNSSNNNNSNNSSNMNRTDRGTITDGNRVSTAAAAAAVIAASVLQVQSRRGIQFRKGDYALVQLSRLSYPQSEAESLQTTVIPVNQYGYPAGYEGHANGTGDNHNATNNNNTSSSATSSTSLAEKYKCGPYKYVLCKIVQVHFDEDERYYTVRRYDTGVEQRADLGFDWMEPIVHERNIEIAKWAAKQCQQTLDEEKQLNQHSKHKKNSKQNRLGWLYCCCCGFCDGNNKPYLFYTSIRQSLKRLVYNVLHGNYPYYCQIQLTCINVLVLCSIVFVFLDSFVLAALDASMDHTMAIVGLVVWFIVALELVFEYIIRPYNYNELIQSDVAYSPTTARHINWCHMIGETIALILYYPQLPCAIYMEQCGVRTPLSSINIALLSVTSSDFSKVAAGQFAIGLIFLRAFGLVRHWKQMWINTTYESISTSSSSSRHGTASSSMDITKNQHFLGQIFLFDRQSPWKRRHSNHHHYNTNNKNKPNTASSKKNDLDAAYEDDDEFDETSTYDTEDDDEEAREDLDDSDNNNNRRDLDNKDDHKITQAIATRTATTTTTRRRQRRRRRRKQQTDEDKHLKNAATIGTALMVVNSHRYFFLLLFLVCVFPMIYTIDVRNPVGQNMFELLQELNVVSNTTNDCDFLKESIVSWLITTTYGEFGIPPVKLNKNNHPNNRNEPNLYVQYAQVLPVRCDWQGPYGIITQNCTDVGFAKFFPACAIWAETVPDDPTLATSEYFGEVLNVRSGTLVVFEESRNGYAAFESNTTTTNEEIQQQEEEGMQTFYVKVIYNESRTVERIYQSTILLVFSMVILTLVGLSVMRNDAARLVLHPIQRMLKIVVRYAENPLYAPATKENRDGTANNHKNHHNNNSRDNEELGNFETEQLINAISKIADLLRKCWGVAGAGIISSNLARTKAGRTVVFNPTIPGKRVYALFGFVGINGFDKQLQSLDKDIMKLINDVANVVHDEVYRWALGDSGQCNKNLGNAFLMVFRIGDFKEVHDRKKRATDVVFNTTSTTKQQYYNHHHHYYHNNNNNNAVKSTATTSSLDGSTDGIGGILSSTASGATVVSRLRKSKKKRQQQLQDPNQSLNPQTTTTTANNNNNTTNTTTKNDENNHHRYFDTTNNHGDEDDTLQLASLPGIQSFADRALLGLLKSYAGLHRDHNMQKWEKDFRLSAGIGKFKINVIFGMDAGWAVEGAVGSEYKIDATYLSPHVNMASRMMSACKQYNVTLLLSQAVEELLSKSARSYMRHLDTVYVKGSNVAQRIYTYDARYAGVDFFLFERSPEQADIEADAYTQQIWEHDQDLKSMRQHANDEFRTIFKRGVEYYIDGDWTNAIATLKGADEMMLRSVLEEGYVDFDTNDVVEESDLLDMNKNSFEIDRVRNVYGDGASKCLVQYMIRRNGIPPNDWHGVRKLDSK